MENQIIQPIVPPSVNPPAIAPSPVPAGIVLIIGFLVGCTGFWAGEKAHGWWNARQDRKRAEAENLLQRCLEKEK